MSSNGSKPAKPDPLGFMTKLSPWVSVYRPTITPPPSSTAPRLIVLFAWMSAGSSAVAKYVRAYQDAYPTAQILLLRSSLMHFLSPPTTITPNIQPALPVIRSVVATSPQQSRPQILLHVFSNGGSAMLSKLRDAYGANFPAHVTIFDSCPGIKNFTTDMNAVTSGMSPLVKVVAYPFFSLLIVLYSICFIGREDSFAYYFRVHNEVTSEARRAYIYSDTDQIVNFHAVVKHATAAEEKGFHVRLEKFHGTKHVMHVRDDEERYWKIIRETWEG
ncbi:unnamed protein product [Clonostachys solani]|uniref:Indole-diterpene biosynthesis protein PaxU n=1 Tax=Clonostachys solani TaxID=160281 RepID=A0A9N9ZKL1_9HYPO|nr:unnamed protein product [Clonostachys solani]